MISDQGYELHAFFGVIVYVIASSMFTPLTGFIGVVVAGVLKEVYDYFLGGTVDIFDFLHTLLCALVVFAYEIIN